jgi:hypothetical protein
MTTTELFVVAILVAPLLRRALAAATLHRNA